MTTFAELGLAPDILRALDDLGYATPTPIQEQVIPLAAQGGDILGAAQTGTGKTAAFALPLIQRMLPFANSSTSPAKHPIRALILTPTRELAIQVEESIKAYCKHIPLRSLVVYGGVSINTQIPILKTGVEILVATPGRLLDHVQNKTLMLTQVNTLVLDEADRMLDMGFMPDLKRIVALLPAQRVNMMFSATFPEEIRKLADSILNNPTFIEVARNDHRGDGDPGGAPGAPRAQAATAGAPDQEPRPAARCWCSPAPSWVATGSPTNSTRPASTPTPFMATRPSRNASRRSMPSRPAPCACWSPPTSPRAASTSRRCPSSSITTCRTTPRTTCTASAAPAVPAPCGEAISLVSESETRYLKDIEKPHRQSRSSRHRSRLRTRRGRRACLSVAPAASRDRAADRPVERHGRART